VYTLLVLSSIVLLMFFITVQVMKNEETGREMKKLHEQLKDHETKPALPALPGSAQLMMRPMRAVNLRCAAS
jgi:hypothetical protein